MWAGFKVIADELRKGITRGITHDTKWKVIFPDQHSDEMDRKKCNIIADYVEQGYTSSDTSYWELEMEDIYEPEMDIKEKIKDKVTEYRLKYRSEPTYILLSKERYAEYRDFARKHMPISYGLTEEYDSNLAFQNIRIVITDRVLEKDPEGILCVETEVI